MSCPRGFQSHVICSCQPPTKASQRPSMPRQDSLTSQLLAVIQLANEAGCYDAADWIKDRLNQGRKP